MENEYLAQLITRIFDQNREYCRLAGLRDFQKLGPPTAEQEIRDIERRFSVFLPKDYREFLMAYNGWRQFEGELDLLSTKQMVDPKMLENVAYVQRLAEEGRLSAVSAGFVIQGSVTSADIVFLDFANRKSGKDPEVVRWEFEEVNRYPSFTAFLEHSLQIIEKLVLSERERLR